jgi:hypothetical protein
MTIVYLGEMTVDTSDLVDLLRGDDEHDVYFFSSANQVILWAQDDAEILVIYETAFANEAEQLKARFVMIERKPGMDDVELFDAVDLAVQKLSTRIRQ